MSKHKNCFNKLIYMLNNKYTFVSEYHKYYRPINIFCIYILVIHILFIDINEYSIIGKLKDTEIRPKNINSLYLDYV